MVKAKAQTVANAAIGQSLDTHAYPSTDSTVWHIDINSPNGIDVQTLATFATNQGITILVQQATGT